MMPMIEAECRYQVAPRVLQFLKEHGHSATTSALLKISGLDGWQLALALDELEQDEQVNLERSSTEGSVMLPDGAYCNLIMLRGAV